MIRPASLVLAAAALLAAASSAAGQSQSARTGAQPPEYPPVYRVELVVFEHVGGDSDRRRALAPAAFATLLDPLLVARAEDAADLAVTELRPLLPMLPKPGGVDEFTPYLESESTTLKPIPPVFAALGEHSGPIRGVLQRLSESDAFEPVATRAWIQPARRGRATPALRMHDDLVVDTLSPGPIRSPLFFPHRLRVPVRVDARGRVVGEPLFDAPPPPQAVYRVDGSARLRRRQFLHLDLDLVWQQRSEAIGPAGEPEWRLHRLAQSRVVEPGRVEYFDSSRFGVLALVRRFEQVVPERPEPTRPATPGDDGRPVTPADG
ncbi:MAG: CsiV family protein [Candidatus Wenzhouxiangella sp. M2_3B_020]